MRVLVALYGLAGLVAALCLAYALTDPTDGQPRVREAGLVIVTGLLWPLCLPCIVVTIALQAVWDRRRVDYYGGRVKGS